MTSLLEPDPSIHHTLPPHVNIHPIPMAESPSPAVMSSTLVQTEMSISFNHALNGLLTSSSISYSIPHLYGLNWSINKGALCNITGAGTQAADVIVGHGLCPVSLSLCPIFSNCPCYLLSAQTPSLQLSVQFIVQVDNGIQSTHNVDNWAGVGNCHPSTRKIQLCLSACKFE
ncbi:hypothetical protein IW261DRAFT_1481124 [Armillaria novae-zelandiae]|uniref:Uncharacterized protein n=1 Tax=Armillaria novae-zelandiae TaxID=153914 RepID=A0AA39P828_9AGAR|nr:hypothetical protein IW261DRAFT_1481124 [Armillaria novae-zelandiae]